MRLAVVKVLLGFLIVVLPVFLLVGTPNVTGTPALAESGSPSETPSQTVTATATATETRTVDIEECFVVGQAGRNIQFQCVDKEGNVVPAGLIRLDPNDIETQFLPGPTETITIRPPAPPRATVTVTARPRPAPPASTVTETIRPAPETVTIVPEPRIVPGPTETATVTVAPDVPDRTRQDDTTDDTIVPDEPVEDLDHALTFPQWSVSAPEAVGIGTLTIFFLVALILLGMWLGYYMGYKDSDKADAKFLRSLLGK